MSDGGTIQQAIGLDLDAAGVLYAGGPVFFRILVLSVVTTIASRLARRAIRRIDDDRTRRQLDFFAPHIIKVVVVAAGLEVLGIDITGMAAVLTTIGFTGAVVFTPIGQNMVAGLVTTLDDMYNVDDVIEIVDVVGKVKSRSLLKTELSLPDGTTAWIPNAVFSENKTRNYTRLDGYRISVEIPLDHEPNRALAIRIMQSELAKLDWPVPHHQPFICFDHVHPEAAVYRAYAWIENRMLEPIYQSLLLTALVDALEEAGISVGYTANLSMYADSQDDTPPSLPPHLALADRAHDQLMGYRHG